MVPQTPLHKSIVQYPTLFYPSQRLSFLLLFFFFIFVFSHFTFISAQIKIKEKVKIQPKVKTSSSVKLLSTTSGGHSLRAVHIWEQTYLGPNKDIPMSRFRFKISADFCNKVIYSDYDYSGNLDFTTTDLLGTSYSVTLLLSQRTLWDPEYKFEGIHGGSFQIYVDGELKNSYNDYWFGNLGVDIGGSEINYYDSGNSVNFYINRECAPILGRMDEDWPTLSITEGHKYLSFYVESTENTIGDSFYSGDYILNGEYPKLIYDKPYYKDAEIKGIVKVEVNGATAFDTVKIIQVKGFELDVKLIPEEIVPNGDADIFLQQIIDYSPVEFPPGQLFDVEIIEGAEYGAILSNNGVDTADAFTQIEQGFRFKAEAELELDSVEVLIKVTTEIEYGAISASIENMDNGSKKVESENLPQSAINLRKVYASNNSQTKIDGGKDKNNALIIIGPPGSGESEGEGGTREIYGIGSVKILKKDSIDHFQITIIPDTLSSKDTLTFTEMARIIVQAKDADSNNVDLDNTIVLKYEVTTNTDYGTFINSNGDTLKTSPVVLENITYADAKAGKIKFAAVKENPDSVVKCNIKVTLQEDETKNGEREAVVLEQTLKIVMEGDREVQPIITGKRYDPEHDAYLNHVGLTNRKPFKVRLTRGGRLIENHSIKLRTAYVNGSGGHDHISPRRPDTAFSYTRRGILRRIPTERARRQNYGSFYSFSSGATFNTDSLRGMTYERAKQDTNDRFEYVASIWGDCMKIYLESLENRLLKDSVKIIERIPDLEPLSTHADYILVGGTVEHQGFPNYAVDNNHFGIQTLNNALKMIASDYSTSHPGIRIRVNDMGLKHGGKFDIDGNWMGSHAQHRLGKNADVSGSGINTADQIVGIDINDMRKIIRNRTSKNPLFHDPPHFHIYSR